MSWLVVWFVRSLKSSHKEAGRKPILMYEDYSDLKSPTSNHVPDIDLAVSVAYDTLKNLFYACVFVLLNP